MHVSVPNSIDGRKGCVRAIMYLNKNKKNIVQIRNLPLPVSLAFHPK